MKLLNDRTPFVLGSLGTSRSSCSEKARRTGFPQYLLQDVFMHLELFDLLNCQRVCRLWHAVLRSCRLIRQRLFLKKPGKGLAPLIEELQDKLVFELHPIFSNIHFDTSIHAEDTTFGRTGSKYLKDSSVRDNYATSPAARRISFDLLKFHPHCIVRNPAGVTVWDVIVQLAEYKKEPANFTYESFFGSKICRERDYDDSKQMSRKDMLAEESVFIPTYTRDPEDNLLFIADSFQSRKGARKGTSFRFWSAFSFCDIPKV